MFKHDSVDIVESTLVTNIGIDRSGSGPDSLMWAKNYFQNALLVHKCNMALESWRIDESSTRHMNICQHFLLLMPWIFRRIHWTKLTFKYRKYKHPSWAPALCKLILGHTRHSPPRAIYITSHSSCSQLFALKLLYYIQELCSWI